MVVGSPFALCRARLVSAAAAIESETEVTIVATRQRAARLRRPWARISPTLVAAGARSGRCSPAGRGVLSLLLLDPGAQGACPAAVQLETGGGGVNDGRRCGLQALVMHEPLPERRTDTAELLVPVEIVEDVGARAAREPSLGGVRRPGRPPERRVLFDPAAKRLCACNVHAKPRCLRGFLARISTRDGLDSSGAVAAEHAPDDVELAPNVHGRQQPGSEARHTVIPARPGLPRG